MLLERVWDYGVEGDDLCCPLFVFESCLERGIYCSERRFVVEISLDIFAYLILNRSVFSFRREEFLFNIKVINIFCTHDNFIRDSLLLSFFRTIINDTKTNVRIFFRDSKVIYFEIQLNIFIYQRDWDISIRIGFHLKNTCTTKYIIFTTCQNE